MLDKLEPEGEFGGTGSRGIGNSFPGSLSLNVGGAKIAERVGSEVPQRSRGSW